ncbi:MAG TPA: hypothetical protein VFN29_12585 [Chiayiivirga sp.]|nr:hypothetical protein [Chiayiivirga sp.]
MFSPLLVEKVIWPLLDWSLAIVQAGAHLAQGTLCSLPVVARHADAE